MNKIISNNLIDGRQYYSLGVYRYEVRLIMALHANPRLN